MQIATLPVSFKLTDDFQSSWMQGCIDTSYDVLCKTFGEPNSEGDAYKVQVEWMIQFSDGTYATIYDWKMGEAYNGEGDGVLPKDIDNWHIGGDSRSAVDRVNAAVSAYLDRTCIA
jgi:hypothetical protein